MNKKKTIYIFPTALQGTIINLSPIFCRQNIKEQKYLNFYRLHCNEQYYVAFLLLPTIDRGAEKYIFMYNFTNYTARNNSKASAQLPILYSQYIVEQKKL